MHFECYSHDEVPEEEPHTDVVTDTDVVPETDLFNEQFEEMHEEVSCHLPHSIKWLKLIEMF